MHRSVDMDKLAASEVGALLLELPPQFRKRLIVAVQSVSALLPTIAGSAQHATIAGRYEGFSFEVILFPNQYLGVQCEHTVVTYKPSWANLGPM